MRKRIQMPSLNRVAPGAKATLEFPLGPTYYKVNFTVTAAAGLDVTDIEKIELMFNGKSKMTFADLQRLIDLNTYYGRGEDTVTATEIKFTLHFFRAEMMDAVYARAPGIGTADLQTLHAEIKVANGAPADIAIEAEALIDPEEQPVGVFFNVSEYPFDSSVAGWVAVADLLRGPYYGAIHLFKADVNDVKVEAIEKGEKITHVEFSKGTLEKEQKEAFPKARVPQTAKATHIDFLTEGDISQALFTGPMSDFRVKMNLATAGAVDIVTETLDTVAVK